MIHETPLRAVLAEMGVQLAKLEKSGSSGHQLTMVMPRLSVRVELDDGYFGEPDFLFREIDDLKRQLFHEVIAHIAKHDRSPLDRLAQIEALAAKVLPRDESQDNGDQRDMRRLLKSKPGAVSWRRNGYGKDPK